MELSEFNYELPEELIAQTPIEKRDESRLMILDKNTGKIEHKIFKDIIDYLEPGDCLVRNNTRVIPARLYGKKETGANVEFILLKNLEGDIWEAMVRPGNKLHIGTKVIFGDGLLKAEILDILQDGTRKVKFIYNGIFNEILDKIGLIINAYNPTPLWAAMIAAAPLATCMPKLRRAMNLNSLFL